MAPDPVPAAAATPVRRSPAAAAPSRRLGAAACVLPVVALGLGARFLGSGLAADLAGGAGYAVLVYLLAAILRPRARRTANALAALVFCVLIELLQLTAIPAQLSAFFPPMRLVLGTTFVPLDLLAYGVGTALALGLDLAAGRLAGVRGTRSTAA